MSAAQCRLNQLANWRLIGVYQLVDCSLISVYQLVGWSLNEKSCKVVCRGLTETWGCRRAAELLHMAVPVKLTSRLVL